jgi:predicted amidohydrolase YtcJ
VTCARSVGDIWLDGSLGSHTAALSEPYADDPTRRGDLEFDDTTLTDLFLEATHAGIQVAVHAIGDLAIEQAVRCWRAVDDQLPDYLEGGVRRLRHRIEHADVIRPDLLDDIAELGLVISCQPDFQARWGQPGGMYEVRLGEERASWTNPLRALADRGVGLAFGSDANSGTIAPWEAVHAAENRRRPQHAMTRLEAVSASSLGGRNAARQDRYVGVVRAGMRADLAVWEDDPFKARIRVTPGPWPPCCVDDAPTATFRCRTGATECVVCARRRSRLRTLPPAHLTTRPLDAP